MMRRLLTLTTSFAIAVVLLPAAAADAFNPATQSHPGACSQETTSVTHAVHDYAENGVLSAFAGLVGIHGSTGVVMRRLDSELVLGVVSRRVITENHGCEGVGNWFSVGPRTLNVGERVGVRVPAKLRARLCSHPGHRCKRITFDAHVVFPTNCWNPNFGRVRVAIYVHKPKVVPKSYKKRRSPKRTVPVPPATPPSTPTPTPVTPVATPTPVPSATDALQCSAGGVVVTLSNAASATASASFTVNGKSYGPLAAGASETVTVPVAPGTSTPLEVVSGGSVLIASTQVTNTCAADPKAAMLNVTCEYIPEREKVEAIVEVELENEASATLPASFELEWPVITGYDLEAEEYETITESETVGPLAAGQREIVVIRLEVEPEFESSVRVTSEGEQIAYEEFGEACGVPE